MLLLTAIAAACTEPNPYINVCGNGVIEPANGEECDDGASGNDDRAGGRCLAGGAAHGGSTMSGAIGPDATKISRNPPTNASASVLCGSSAPARNACPNGRPGLSIHANPVWICAFDRCTSRKRPVRE